MAGKKQPPTEAYKRAKAANAILKDARIALDKAENPKTQAAYDAAKKAASEAGAVLAREKFERVAGIRMTKALDALTNITKTANARSYGFTQADIDKINNTLQNAVDTVKNSFAAALTGSKKSGSVKARFQF